MIARPTAEEFAPFYATGVALAEAFTAMLPLLTDQLDSRLAEQEHALDELGISLDEAGDVLPVYGRTTGQVLQVGRFLAWLVSAIIALHGCHLLLSVAMGRRYSL